LELTLEQINVIRSKTGQEPLTELPTPAAPASTESEEEKKRLEEEAKQKEKQIPNPPPAPISEIDEDAVVKYLKGRGIQVESLNDLNKPLTAEDIEKQKEARENEKLTFGLNKGLFNRKTHEQFILDRNNKQDLVYAHYYQEAKKEDDTLTDEEIQTEFADKYGLSSEPNTRKHKRGQEELNLLGDLILNKKYANIYKLDAEYDSYEGQVKSQKELENKIKAQAPVYKKDIDDVFSDLKKITTKLGEDEEYDVELTEDALNELKGKFLDAGYVASKIASGYTKDQLKDTAYTALLREQFPTIIKKIVEQALYKKQKGVKGILPVNPSSKEGQSELSEQQQKIMQRTFPNQQPVVAN
jgi:hypothetical protein